MLLLLNIKPFIMTIIILYGEFGVDFKSVANYFKEKLGYSAVTLYQLGKADI